MMPTRSRITGDGRLTVYMGNQMVSSMKELRFVGRSLRDLARFPAEAKRAAGFELWQVQNGLEPSDWKPMTAVGPRRALYVARFAGAVYVRHAFGKKAQRTLQSHVELAARRCREIAKK